MKFIALLLIAPILLMAQQQRQRVPPEQVEAELAEAEEQFNHALTLFNPWYTGPLITPSATMVAPGNAMYQPYIYFTDNYAAFNSHRESVKVPNEFQVFVQPVIIQIGVTPQVDTTLIWGAKENWKENHRGGGITDVLIQLGFLFTKQTLYAPKAKFTVGQTFPTGPYKNLNKDGLLLDGIGAGAWTTTFTLTFGKVLFWATKHPMNTRLSLNYTINTPIHVTNFNAYGGGIGTHGTVHPGNTFAADLGLEMSINQPWVIALDVVYNCTNRTKFNGTTSPTAPVGPGYSDQLSLAPAIEYNFNDLMGILWGVWFTVYGRNSANFVSGVFSWYWEFPN